MQVTVKAVYKYTIEMNEAEVDLLVNLLDRLPSSGIALVKEEISLIDDTVFSIRQSENLDE